MDKTRYSKKDKINKINIILESFLLKKIKIEEIYHFPKNSSSQDMGYKVKPNKR